MRFTARRYVHRPRFRCAQLYESYLKARDFVVGKDAVAGVLAKIKTSDHLATVEQEQIRNLYKKADGR
eukprot:SAG11_NODE_292_length_11180_cov_6.023825_4_plen_68_part_00